MRKCVHYDELHMDIFAKSHSRAVCSSVDGHVVRGQKPVSTCMNTVQESDDETPPPPKKKKCHVKRKNSEDLITLTTEEICGL